MQGKTPYKNIGLALAYGSSPDLVRSTRESEKKKKRRVVETYGLTAPNSTSNNAFPLSALPAFHDDGANGVEYDDSVRALASSCEYEFIATMPEGGLLLEMFTIHRYGTYITATRYYCPIQEQTYPDHIHDRCTR